MFRKSIYFIITCNFVFSLTATRDRKITINLDNDTATDLQSYLTDLQIAVTSTLYTANINARLVSELQERLANKQVDCDGESAGADEVSGSPWSDYRWTSARAAHKLRAESLAWNDARKSCMSDGARLAVIEDEREAQMLAKSLENLKLAKSLENLKYWSSNVNSSSVAFIGVHSLFSKNEWVTISGESFNRSSIRNSTNALKAATHNCIVLNSEASLGEADCEKEYPYFCEIQIK